MYMEFSDQNGNSTMVRGAAVMEILQAGIGGSIDKAIRSHLPNGFKPKSLTYVTSGGIKTVYQRKFKGWKKDE